MNGRVVALVAVVAVFVGLWSAEHKNRVAYRENWRVAHTNPARQPIPARVLSAQVEETQPRITAETCWSISSIEYSLDEPTSPCFSPGEFSCPEFSHPVANNAPVENEKYQVDALPLPDGIVAGRYRVIDNHGVVSLVEVIPEQVTAGSGAKLRDYYVKVLGDDHWVYESVTALEASLVVASDEPIESDSPQDLQQATLGSRQNSLERILQQRFRQAQRFLETAATWMNAATDSCRTEPWGQLADELRIRWLLAGQLRQQTKLALATAQLRWTDVRRQLDRWLTSLIGGAAAQPSQAAVPQTDGRRQ